MKITSLALAATLLALPLFGQQSFSVSDGTTSVDLDDDLLASIGWSVTGAFDTVTPAAGFDVGFDILETSTFNYDENPFAINFGEITHVGTVTLSSDGTSAPAGDVTVGNFTIDSGLNIIDTATTGAALFTGSPTFVDSTSVPGQLIVEGDLLITEALSNVLVGNTSLAGTDAGNFQVNAIPEPSTYFLGGLAIMTGVIIRRMRKNKS
ncbi:MAG: hypothetical protein ACFBZ8_09625 [Opitutales bacterium]